jgi:hypothetical protein
VSRLGKLRQAWHGIAPRGGAPLAWIGSDGRGTAGIARWAWHRAAGMVGMARHSVVGKAGMVWPGLHWIGGHGWHGSSRLDPSGYGMVRLARQHVVSLARAGMAGMARRDKVGFGSAGAAWHDLARRGGAGTARTGRVRLCPVRHCRHGTARRGCLRTGLVGKALQAWLAKARPEQVRQARHGVA